MSFKLVANPKVTLSSRSFLSKKGKSEIPKWAMACPMARLQAFFALWVGSQTLTFPSTALTRERAQTNGEPLTATTIKGCSTPMVRASTHTTVALVEAAAMTLMPTRENLVLQLS
jgi:hypothetical protein